MNDRSRESSTKKMCLLEARTPLGLIISVFVFGQSSLSFHHMANTQYHRKSTAKINSQLNKEKLSTVAKLLTSTFRLIISDFLYTSLLRDSIKPYVIRQWRQQQIENICPPHDWKEERNLPYKLQSYGPTQRAPSSHGICGHSSRFNCDGSKDRSLVSLCF